MHPSRILFHVAGLTLCLLTLAACQETPEGQIEDRIDELVDALNARDLAAGSRLFVGGEIPVVDIAGDSNVVYQLFVTPGGEDFELAKVSTTVIDDRARSQVEIHGNVVRDGVVAGEMALPLKLDLRRDESGVWLIVP